MAEHISVIQPSGRSRRVLAFISKPIAALIVGYRFLSPHGIKELVVGLGDFHFID